MKYRYAIITLLVAVAIVGVLIVHQTIADRKAESQYTVLRVVNIDETTIDPAEWGKNYPRQYDAYKRTVDMERTRYGGSEADPFAVGADGIHKTKSHIESDPRLVTMWSGYAFSIDFREERGHAYMLHDQRETERVLKKPQTGACLHCHASTTVPYRKAGIEAGSTGSLTDPFLSDAAQAQLMKGFEILSAEPYAKAAEHVTHPVACIDCHDPQSMNLRVTRPGFIRGIAALAASDDTVPHMPSILQWRKGDRKKPYDPNKLASRQEMRSFTCGQCHVEYYCGPKTTLFYPWNKGLKIEQIEAFYAEYKFPDGSPFSDWKHKITGADVIKAQHPEFELWSQGIHARSGVACADCHMPYVREGALKVSDHQVRSPMLHVARSCQVCHRYEETEIKDRVAVIQDRTKKLMDRALDALVALIEDIETATTVGATNEELIAPREYQRRAQLRVDFINAENSMGFHAPQEAARILGEAIDFAQKGRLEVAAIPGLH